MRALRTTTRVTATLTAAGVMALAAGPAFAADTTVVAQSEAEALYIAVGGMAVTDQLGGQFRAERTASGETTEGSNEPQADLLNNQDSLAAGTLAQDARTGLAGNRGVSDACSGIAGPGSSFVGVGDDGRCLDPGRRAEIALTPRGLNLASLLDVELVRGSGSLNTLLGALSLPGGTSIQDVLADLNLALDPVFSQLGTAGVFAGLSAITSECDAGPGAVAAGDAELTDVDLFVRLPAGAPQRRVDLLDLQANPKPNTKIATQLDEVFDLVLTAALRSLSESDLPAEITDPLAGVPLADVKDAVKEQALAQLADQLGPLEQNLIDGTLNKQTRAPGEIEVTAVDIDVLPAVEQQAGFVPAELRLARSQCGPGATVTDTPTTPTDPDSPDVPRVVPAGVGAPLDGVAARGNDATVPAALALLALMTFGSAIGFSTSRSRAGA